MRILTHPMHTGYDYELAKTGHEFFSVCGHWDHGQRPKPSNWTLVQTPEGAFDLGIFADQGAFDWMRKTPLPLIHIVHADAMSGQFPQEIETRVAAVVFSSQDVASRNIFRKGGKAKVIGHSIDTSVYCGYRGDGGNVLCVGNLMRRPDKGLEMLLAINSAVPVDLLGASNEGISCAIGHAANYDDLLERYRSYKVFLNSSRIVSTSLLEAMATGMPVVTFRSGNFRDLTVDGFNCFIVDTVAEAVERIRRLLGDKGLRISMGLNARGSVGECFRPEKFKERWNGLLTEVSREQIS